MVSELDLHAKGPRIDPRWEHGNRHKLSLLFKRLNLTYLRLELEKKNHSNHLFYLDINNYMYTDCFFVFVLCFFNISVSCGEIFDTQTSKELVILILQVVSILFRIIRFTTKNRLLIVP